MSKRNSDPHPDPSRPIVETRYKAKNGKVIVVRSYVRDPDEYDLDMLARALLDTTRVKLAAELPVAKPCDKDVA
jgi:hypothetical protein